MPDRNDGIEFEQAVAAIQAQLDPNAEVSHDERLEDRLGQRRQFDVVLRGQFAGHEMLGIIECKDLTKRVGTPEIDAFITKSADVNANFKVLMSRRGFTKPAIDKAAHYGIKPLSLIPDDEVNAHFKIGNYWFADIYYWETMSLTLDFSDPNKRLHPFRAEDVTINARKLIRWFTNYLASEHNMEATLGWSVGLYLKFENEQRIEIAGQGEHLCSGVHFSAKRSVAKKCKFVGIYGPGIFDWQSGRARFPPNSTITTDSVQANFMSWDDRESDEIPDVGVIHVKIIGHNKQFDIDHDAPNLMAL